MPDLRRSYFAIPNPLERLDRWLNPPYLRKTVSINSFPLDVEWTRRADRELQERGAPLVVELQLYFSSVVKKRVLFADADGAEAVAVTNQLAVRFRTVQSADGDPAEFTRHFPVEQDFDSAGARSMHPKRLLIDFRAGSWVGEYWI